MLTLGPDGDSPLDDPPLEGEGDIVNCKRDLDDLGDLARSAYVSYFMKTIHYVPLECPWSAPSYSPTLRSKLSTLSTKLSSQGEKVPVRFLRMIRFSLLAE